LSDRDATDASLDLLVADLEAVVDAAKLERFAMKLHCVFPSTDGARGTCLWEAQSVNAVKHFVETLTSGISRNDYMVVEATHAMGLPK
jgi:hypothetical protein